MTAGETTWVVLRGIGRTREERLDVREDNLTISVSTTDELVLATIETAAARHGIELRRLEQTPAVH